MGVACFKRIKTLRVLQISMGNNPIRDKSHLQNFAIRLRRASGYSRFFPLWNGNNLTITKSPCDERQIALNISVAFQFDTRATKPKEMTTEKTLRNETVYSESGSNPFNKEEPFENTKTTQTYNPVTDDRPFSTVIPFARIEIPLSK